MGSSSVAPRNHLETIETLFSFFSIFVRPSQEQNPHPTSLKADTASLSFIIDRLFTFAKSPDHRLPTPPQDLCGHHSCDTLGMADVGTICSPERSCAVIEDDGLHAAFTVAHEIGKCLNSHSCRVKINPFESTTALPPAATTASGHLLGLSHDDSKFCEERFGVNSDKRLMSSILTSIDASKPWSRCTSATITDFFDDGNGECRSQKRFY